MVAGRVRAKQRYLGDTERRRVLGDFLASGVNIFAGTWLQSAGASLSWPS